jgi:hypothetical protein
MARVIASIGLAGILLGVVNPDVEGIWAGIGLWVAVALALWGVGAVVTRVLDRRSDPRKLERDP